MNNKQIIRIIGMVCVGISVGLFPIIGWWFLIPWCISWFIYDLNTKYE